MLLSSPLRYHLAILPVLREDSLKVARYSYAWRRRRPDDLVAFAYACALCHVEDQPFGTHSQLERAHLDGDRSNDAPENVAVLCRTCHRKHDLPALLLAYRERRADERDAERPILMWLKETA